MWVILTESRLGSRDSFLVRLRDQQSQGCAKSTVRRVGSKNAATPTLDMLSSWLDMKLPSLMPSND